MSNILSGWENLPQGINSNSTQPQSVKQGQAEERPTPLEKQLVELFNTSGQMNVLDVVKYVRGLQELLKFDHCPDILIQYPYLIKPNKESTEESKQWAADVIANHERLLVEKPIVVQMNEQEYESYKNWEASSPAPSDAGKEAVDDKFEFTEWALANYKLHFYDGCSSVELYKTFKRIKSKQ